MTREIKNRSPRPDLDPLGGFDPCTYPLAAFIANRVRPESAEVVYEERPDYLRYRWGDAPAWWDERDSVPAWRQLRQEAVPS
jgi:hypothetical protein